MPSKPLMAGPLRHRVTIERATIAQDAHGAATETWAELAQRWASIEALSGREQMRGDSQTPTVTHKITIRYLAGLTPRDRIVFGARTYNIEWVDDVDQVKHKQIVMAKEQV